MRRILRRAVYYLSNVLKSPGKQLRNLIPAVAQVMKSTYPYLEAKVPVCSGLTPSTIVSE
jgi:alanyl-tRNA synthetase